MVLPNALRSKCNQTKKLGQLIEYNMRNDFFEKLQAKCGAETTAQPLSKTSKLSITYNCNLKCYSLFLLYVQVENYQNILTQRC